MKAKDLAKLLGVSPATVSLVLNNKPGISDSLRKELLAKIEKLGCESMMCSSCREGKAPGAAQPGGKRTIAYLNYQDCGGGDGYFFPGVLQGAEVEARESGFAFSLLHRSCHLESSLSQLFEAVGNVVGAVVQCDEITEQILADISSVDIPFVFIDVSAEKPGVNSVRVNNWQGISELLRYLKEKGHREIGYVTSGWESECYRDRRISFECTMRDLGLELNDKNIFYSTPPDDDLYEHRTLAELFSKAGRLPTALVCANDRQALRAINALREIGLSVPGDVSVTGFDNSPFAQMTSPRLTTVNNSSLFMGRACVIMLQGLLRLKALGFPYSGLEYSLPAEMVERESVKDLNC